VTDKTSVASCTKGLQREGRGKRGREERLKEGKRFFPPSALDI